MGIVHMGIPERITLELARLNGSKVFIESGTYLGSTSNWASKHFEVVHTIELSKNLFERHSKELTDKNKVIPHQGDSREILPQITREIGDRRCLFWLDGHWSGGETAGGDNECPLVGELKCLAKRRNDILLIDDARLFLCAPPRPHKPSHWPTISEIIFVFFESGYRPFVQIVDDVIFIIPNDKDLRECLVEYSQDRADQFWSNFSKQQKQGTSAVREQLDPLLKMID